MPTCRDCGRPIDPRFDAFINCTPCAVKETAAWRAEAAETARLARLEAGKRGAEALERWRKEQRWWLTSQGVLTT